MVRKILLGLSLACLVIAVFVLIGYPAWSEQSVASPSVELDLKEKEKAVLDTQVVLEASGDISEVYLEVDGQRINLLEEDIGLEKITEFPFLNLPWVEIKTRLVINPNKKKLFEPETKYKVHFSSTTLLFETITLPKVIKARPCNETQESGRGFIGLSTTTCIEIFFNEEVVWESQYLSVSPPTDVDVQPLKYEDSKVSLVFAPVERWENSAKYILTIKAGLKDNFAHELPVDFSLNFTTQPPPKVEETAPVGENFPIDSKVRVKFDRYDVYLSPNLYFEIEPEVEGTLEWEDGLTFIWKARDRLAYSTTYLLSVGGKSWAGDPIPLYRWSFKTEDPPVFLEIQGSNQSPTTLRAVPFGGTGEYSIEWSIGETGEEIYVDLPAGEVWSISATVYSGNHTAYVEKVVYGPSLPPPVLEETAPQPVIGESAFQPPQVPTPGGGNKIVLTFDDSGHMAEILDILAQYGAKAIFFPTGQWANAVPDLIQRAINEGHLVCNHTYSHANLITLSAEGVQSEILGGAVGNCNLLRPPYGAHNAFVDSIAAELGYLFFMWDIDTRDWARRYPGGDQEILKIVLSQAFPGAVVLMHMHVENTIKVLPTMIERLQAGGYIVSW